MNAQLETVVESFDPEVFPTYSVLTPAPKFPSWKQIKKQHWDDIIKRYDSGARDKETVCARTAYVAALKACNGWPADSFDELTNEGYAYALGRWGDYDPTKASANGIAGFLYKSTLLTLRKIAQERFTIHGKRIHKPTDVLPKVVELADEESIDRALWRLPVTSAAKVDYDGDDEGESPHTVTRPDRYKAPRGPSEPFLAHVANEQLRMRISDLLALLPREEAELLASWFGVNGVERTLTVEELADNAECSVPTMYRRLNTLLVDLLHRAKATGV